MGRPQRVASLALSLVVALPALAAACGGEEEREGAPAADTAPSLSEPVSTAGDAQTETTTSPEESDEPDDGALARRPPGEDGLRVPATRASIVVGESDFGRVLFDANGQVVYVFEIDRRNRSNCVSAECVEAWPPVLTKQAPSAGTGVRAGLLGTIRRGDGSVQVTYAGRPLYFYEHEGPREIRCHNVDLHGGLWWVVTPRGDPAA